MNRPGFPDASYFERRELWEHQRGSDGSPGARGAHGEGAASGAWLAMGGDQFDRREDRLYGRVAASLGAPSRDWIQWTRGYEPFGTRALRELERDHAWSAALLP